MEDNTVYSELQKSLKSTAIDIFGDVSQLGLSELIQWVTSEETVLSDIPVLKWFISGINTVSSISAVFAVKKYYAFIKPIKDEKFFNSESAHKQIEEICGSKKKLNFVMEQTLFSLDKFEAEIKAKWLSILFIKTFKEKVFTIEEYTNLLFCIGNLNSANCKETLEVFYNAYKNKDDEQIQLARANKDYSSLSMSGLIRLPSGATAFDNIGGAYINELGIRFYENVLNFEE